MKKASLILLFFMSLNAFALGRNNVGINLGMAGGGLTLGADYEYLWKRSVGVGGFARFFQKDDPAHPGIFAVGANARVHHRVESVDLSVAPGFALINVDGAAKDTTSIGPTFSIAATFMITDAVSIGLENTGYWIWLDSDFRGQIVDDTSLRFTFNF